MEALERFNKLAPAPIILFVVDNIGKILGSLTDGDIRRGLLAGRAMDTSVIEVANRSPKVYQRDQLSLTEINHLREQRITFIPIINEEGVIVDILDLVQQRTILPVNAIIMAGGRGSRLKPLTDNTPKPLLQVAGKPIIQYNLELLSRYGITDIEISVSYLKEQLKTAFEDGKELNLSISYIEEDHPLGTIGPASKSTYDHNDYVLVMNSDLLTNVDLEKFYMKTVDMNADIMIASVPYVVNVPYAILEENKEGYIKEISEKPTYSFYSNAGIYLIKTSILKKIPFDSYYDATDLIEATIAASGKVAKYKIKDYWLDIGKHDDFRKANEEVHEIDF